MVQSEKGSFLEMAKKNNQMRLCAYIRVSDEKQTVENQELAIKNYIKNHPGWEIIDWFKDEGVSAFVERPHFNQMKEAIAMHLYNAIIAYKIDRIGRSVIDLHKNIDFFKEHNCEVIFVADQIDTSTPQGRLFFNIQASFAEFEAEMIRERTKLGLARVRVSGSKSGKPIGRPREKISDAEIVKLYNDGNGLQRIANMVGIQKSSVRYRLKKLGITLRPCSNFKDKREGSE